MATSCVQRKFGDCVLFDNCGTRGLLEVLASSQAEVMTSFAVSEKARKIYTPTE